MKDQHLILIATGEHHLNTLSSLSRTLASYGCNITQCRVVRLAKLDCMLFQLSGNWDAIAKVESMLHLLERKLKLEIFCQRSAGRPQQPTWLPYSAQVVSLDNIGTLSLVSDLFSKQGIHIEELSANSYTAPSTGTLMSSLAMSLSVPAEVHISSLREQFMTFCDDNNLDAILEPCKPA